MVTVDLGKTKKINGARKTDGEMFEDGGDDESPKQPHSRKI